MTPSNHLSRELLRAVERGDMPRSELRRLLQRHARHVCETCRDEWRLWRLERSLGAHARLRVLVLVLTWLAGLDEERVQRLEAAAERTRRSFDELLEQAPEMRSVTLLDDDDRFSDPQLGHLLIEAARERVLRDPWEALDLARLALEVAWSLPPDPGHGGLAVELRALAHAHCGNCLRAQGELMDADNELAAARDLLHWGGIVDLPLCAELDRFEANLRREQRRHDEAQRLYHRAILLYELGGRAAEAASTRLSLVILHQLRGHPERALAETRRAVEDIDPDEHPSLALAARHNLTASLCDLGLWDEAREVFRLALPLYDRIPGPAIRLRQRWLQARLARGLGEDDIADRLLRRVKEGFLSQGMTLDAAQASVELAELLLARGGDPEEIRGLAQEALVIFEDQQIEPEARRARIILEHLNRLIERTERLEAAS